MLSLDKLVFKNFVTYKEQVFDFRKLFEKDNILLIYGKNLDDATFADDNGAGKSLIHKGLVYCLANRTTQGSNKDSLIGKHSNSMSVACRFIDQSGNKLWIKRYRKDKVHGNSVRFKINGKEKYKGTSTETTNLILRVLGLTYKQLINTSIFESEDERSRFAYLGDKAAKELLAQIKGLDIFLVCEKIAKDKAKELKSEIEKLRTKIENFKWQIKHLKKEEVKFKKLKDEFSEKKENEIRDLKTSFEKKNDNLTLQRDKLIKSINLRKKIIRAAKENLIDEDVIEKVFSKISKIMSKVLVAKEQQSIINSDIRRITALISDIKENSQNKIGQKCEACGSKITRKNLKRHLKELNDSLDFSKESKKDIDKKINKFTRKEDSLRLKEDKFKDKNTKLMLEIVDAKTAINLKKVSLENCERELSEADKHFTKLIRNLQNKKNEFEEQANAISEKIIKINQKKSKKKDKLKVLEKEFKYVNAWSLGYGKEEIQTYALQSTVLDLNEQITKFSEILTDGMIDMELLTEKRQGNKVIRNIFELVINDLEKKHLPFKEWSKGQKKRIDIILSFALMNLEENLISEIFLDELFDGVDKTGISKIINLLNLETKDNKRFIVFSHSESVKSLFYNKGVVTLKDGISTFQLQ